MPSRVTAPLPAVGVIGAGAMGMGVVGSLLRGGFTTHVRDIRAAAQAEAAALGAACHPDAASLARACDIAVVLVIDAAQVDAVLFDAGGAASAFRRDSVVMLCSTVAPEYTSDLAARLAGHGVALVDAPVSGGPKRAADGMMTMMVAGDSASLAICEPVFAAVAGRVFHVGARRATPPNSRSSTTFSPR